MRNITKNKKLLFLAVFRLFPTVLAIDNDESDQIGSLFVKKAPLREGVDDMRITKEDSDLSVDLDFEHKAIDGKILLDEKFDPQAKDTIKRSEQLNINLEAGEEFKLDNLKLADLGTVLQGDDVETVLKTDTMPKAEAINTEMPQWDGVDTIIPKSILMTDAKPREEFPKVDREGIILLTSPSEETIPLPVDILDTPTPANLEIPGENLTPDGNPGLLTETTQEIHAELGENVDPRLNIAKEVTDPRLQAVQDTDPRLKIVMDDINFVEGVGNTGYVGQDSTAYVDKTIRQHVHEPADLHHEQIPNKIEPINEEISQKIEPIYDETPQKMESIETSNHAEEWSAHYLQKVLNEKVEKIHKHIGKTELALRNGVDTPGILDGGTPATIDTDTPEPLQSNLENVMKKAMTKLVDARTEQAALTDQIQKNKESVHLGGQGGMREGGESPIKQESQRIEGGTHLKQHSQQRIEGVVKHESQHMEGVVEHHLEHVKDEYFWNWGKDLAKKSSFMGHEWYENIRRDIKKFYEEGLWDFVDMWEYTREKRGDKVGEKMFERLLIQIFANVTLPDVNGNHVLVSTLPDINGNIGGPIIFQNGTVNFLQAVRYVNAHIDFVLLAMESFDAFWYSSFEPAILQTREAFLLLEKRSLVYRGGKAAASQLIKSATQIASFIITRLTCVHDFIIFDLVKPCVDFTHDFCTECQLNGVLTALDKIRYLWIDIIHEGWDHFTDAMTYLFPRLSILLELEKTDRPYQLYADSLGPGGEFSASRKRKINTGNGNGSDSTGELSRESGRSDRAHSAAGTWFREEDSSDSSPIRDADKPAPEDLDPTGLEPGEELGLRDLVYHALNGRPEPRLEQNMTLWRAGCHIDRRHYLDEDELAQEYDEYTFKYSESGHISESSAEIAGSASAEAARATNTAGTHHAGTPPTSTGETEIIPRQRVSGPNSHHGSTSQTLEADEFIRVVFENGKGSDRKYLHHNDEYRGARYQYDHKKFPSAMTLEGQVVYFCHAKNLYIEVDRQNFDEQFEETPVGAVLSSQLAATLMAKGFPLIGPHRIIEITAKTVRLQPSVFINVPEDLHEADLAAIPLRQLPSGVGNMLRTQKRLRESALRRDTDGIWGVHYASKTQFRNEGRNEFELQYNRFGDTIYSAAGEKFIFSSTGENRNGDENDDELYEDDHGHGDAKQAGARKAGSGHGGSKKGKKKSDETAKKKNPSGEYVIVRLKQGKRSLLFWQILDYQPQFFMGDDSSQSVWWRLGLIVYLIYFSGLLEQQEDGELLVG